MTDSCVVCGKPAVHTHHRKMRSQGGGDEPSNLLRVCLEDHNAIHANPSESYARGLLVHSWADPAEVTLYTGDFPKTDYTVGGHEQFETPVVVVSEGVPCPTCKRRVPHKKKASTPSSKVWSTRIPIDDAQTFSELVDAAAEHHGLTSKPNHRYWCLLYAVTLLLQQQPGELPA